MLTQLWLKKKGSLHRSSQHRSRADIFGAFGLDPFGRFVLINWIGGQHFGSRHRLAVCRLDAARVEAAEMPLVNECSWPSRENMKLMNSPAAFGCGKSFMTPLPPATRGEPSCGLGRARPGLFPGARRTQYRQALPVARQAKVFFGRSFAGWTCWPLNCWKYSSPRAD